MTFGITSANRREPTWGTDVPCKEKRMATARQSSKLGRTFTVLVAGGLLATACGGAGESADVSASPDGSEVAAEGAPDPVELTMQSYTGADVMAGRVMRGIMDGVSESSDGAVAFDAKWDGSQYTVTETLAAVTDGRLEMGHFSAAYYPDAFPLTTATHLPFVTDNTPAVAATMLDLYQNNEQYRAEFQEQGLHLVAFIPAPAGIAMAPEPFDSLDYLRSATNRGSADFVTALQAIGADDIVTPPANELYEALQRGLADTAVGFVLDVGVQMSLHEVTPHFVDVGAGQWADNLLVMSLDAWESLPESVQTAFDTAAQESIARIPELLEETEGAACEQLLEDGGSASRLPDEVIEEWASTAEQPLRENWVQRAEQAGVEAPQEFMDAYLETIETYEAEYADFRTGIAACAEQNA